MPPVVAGFSLVLFAAVCVGALAVPMQRRRRFELENMFVPATVLMMLVFPFLMAQVVLPDWRSAVQHSGLRTVLAGAGFGLAWGAGGILFGYGVTMAGMSVGYAVIMGINTAVGSLLPFLVKSPGDLLKTSGMVIVLGIAGSIAGVAVCGRAGALRERTVRKGYTAGFAAMVCAASGILSACANLGFAFTGRVGDEARKLGAAPVFATLGSWLPVFWGAAFSLLAWFVGVQLRKGTWRNNFGPGAAHDWMMSVLMAVLWFLATIPYGMGAFYLGRLGTSIGWALNIAFSLLVANGFGFWRGEWKGAPAVSLRSLAFGLGILLTSVAVLSVGSFMAEK